eukprot:1107777-Prorocentrum_minimum.AAC.3
MRTVRAGGFKGAAGQVHWGGEQGADLCVQAGEQGHAGRPQEAPCHPAPEAGGPRGGQEGAPAQEGKQTCRPMSNMFRVGVLIQLVQLAPPNVESQLSLNDRTVTGLRQSSIRDPEPSIESSEDSSDSILGGAPFTICVI